MNKGGFGALFALLYIGKMILVVVRRVRLFVVKRVAPEAGTDLPA